MQKNCPFIPYWNSSPYGGALPNDDTVGDVHIWRNAFMSDNMEERIDLRAYDKVESKFVSEYGYVGPCCIESIRSYLDLGENEDIVREGRPWEMHLNVFEKETVYAGIERFYVDHPEHLSIIFYMAAWFIIMCWDIHWKLSVSKRIVQVASSGCTTTRGVR